MKLPYEKFYSVGNVNYYYLDFKDMAYPFVAMETCEQIRMVRKFLFFKKEKNINVPVSLKLMPLNSLILFTMHNALLLNESTYELDVEDKKIPIFQTWEEADLEELKSAFNSHIAAVAGSSNYSFPKTIKNPVAKGFTKDGFLFLGLETHGAMNRTYWLVRTNKYGNTHLINVAETGPMYDPITTSNNIYFVDRDFMKAVIDDFKNGKFDREEKELKIEDMREEE